jgi:hypothetical protein
MKGILSGAKDAATKKAKVVDLGKQGSFKITKPGALKKKAKAADESTKEFARSHDKGKSTTAKQSRAALGLMGVKQHGMTLTV